jgi:hypothetical protein
MLAKLFAVAAGCTFAVVSFDAGAVPALPLPLQQAMLSRKSRAAADRAGIAALMAGWVPVGRRCWFLPTPWGRGASAAGENVRLKFENPAPAGFFV